MNKFCPILFCALLGCGFTTLYPGKPVTVGDVETNVSSDPCALAVPITGFTGYAETTNCRVHLSWDTYAHPEIIDYFSIQTNGVEFEQNFDPNLVSWITDTSIRFTTNTEYIFSVSVVFNNACPTATNGSIALTTGNCTNSLPAINLVCDVTRGISEVSYTVDGHFERQGVLAELDQCRLESTELGLVGNCECYNLWETNIVGVPDQSPLLPNSTNFFYIVTQFINGCPPVNSEPVEVITGCLASAPHDLTPTPGDGTFQVDWLIDLNPISKLTVRWGVVTGVYTESADIAASDRSYLIEGLTNGVEIFVVVDADDGNGCTARSAETSGTPAP